MLSNIVLRSISGLYRSRPFCTGSIPKIAAAESKSEEIVATQTPYKPYDTNPFVWILGAVGFGYVQFQLWDVRKSAKSNRHRTKDAISHARSIEKRVVSTEYVQSDKNKAIRNDILKLTEGFADVETAQAKLKEAVENEAASVDSRFASSQASAATTRAITFVPAILCWFAIGTAWLANRPR